MDDIITDYPYLVAERDGNIVGLAYASSIVGRAVYKHSPELSIYLSPAEKGHDTGRKLYTALNLLWE